MAGFFFICPVKSPQCNDKNSKKKKSTAVFLPRVLMYQLNVNFHFRWGTKPPCYPSRPFLFQPASYKIPICSTKCVNGAVRPQFSLTWKTGMNLLQ